MLPVTANKQTNKQWDRRTRGQADRLTDSRYVVNCAVVEWMWILLIVGLNELFKVKASGFSPEPAASFSYQVPTRKLALAMGLGVGDFEARSSGTLVNASETLDLPFCSRICKSQRSGGTAEPSNRSAAEPHAKRRSAVVLVVVVVGFRYYAHLQRPRERRQRQQQLDKF